MIVIGKEFLCVTAVELEFCCVTVTGLEICFQTAMGLGSSCLNLTGLEFVVLL